MESGAGFSHSFLFLEVGFLLENMNQFGTSVSDLVSPLLEELGFERNSVGIASLYKNIASTLVIDEVDSELSPRIESEGMRALTTDTIMDTPIKAAALARAVLAEVSLAEEE